MNTRFIFVRHGELDGEDSSILHGANDKVSLSEKGKETMRRISSKLGDIDAIFSSAEIRTKDSAEILAKSVSTPIRYLDALQGRMWGDFAGKSWKDVEKMLDGKTLGERRAFVPPYGESWEQFEERMINALEVIGKEYKGKKICIVSHGSSIRVILPRLFNIPIAESLKLYPDYGSMSMVEFDGKKYSNPKFNRLTV